MKTSVMIIILSLLLILSGCTAKDEYHGEVDINTTVAYEEEGIDFVFVGPTNSFEEKEFNDPSAPQVITVNLWGETYELTYVCSRIYSFEVITVNVYTGYDLKVDNYVPEIHIDVETGNIVNYVNLPYPEILKNEADYKQFIAETVTSNVDLSKFNYSCETTWAAISERGSHVEHTESFKSDFAENEEFTYYNFNYEMFVDGIKINNEITASFQDNGTFDLKIVEFEFDEELVKEYLSYIPKVDKTVETFYRSTATDDITVMEINVSENIENRTIVISGERYYVITLAAATYYSNNDRWGVKHTREDPGVHYKHFVTDVTDFISEDNICT